jgi:hypothetical protein
MALDIKPPTPEMETVDEPVGEPVHAVNYAQDQEFVEAPAPSSPLGDIKAKRAAFLGKMHKDVHVPRWNSDNGLPYLFIRIAPISQTDLFNAIKKRRDEYEHQVQNREVPAEDSGMKTNADLVALACKGIYFLADEEDLTKYAVTGSTDEAKWTKFDGATGPITAEHLGISVNPLDPVASLVRGVFSDTDGDLLWFTNRLLEFSNLSNSEADTAF